MSGMDDVPVPHEVVIIRRRPGGEEEGHHGGAWKIAYADFMTAMMAFFLVMWLINASDKKTITQIANYFNPLRLNDKVVSVKGLREVEGESAKKNADAGSAPDKASHEPDPKPAKTKNSSAAQAVGDHSDKAGIADDDLFKDPYGVLARLAERAAQEKAEAGSQSGSSVGIETGDGGLAKGDTFRDPFEPQPKGAARRERHRFDAQPRAEPDVTMQQGADTPAPTGRALGPATLADTRQGTGNGGFNPASKADAAEAARLASEIQQALAGAAPLREPRIEVAAVAEGVLISLTDDYDFGMFAVSSAEPRPELVVVMDQIARILAGRPGSLVVRGHTDARPFKSGTNDNWRLSASRAQMAYHMLVRGGVSETRFERIEGYADRSPKVSGDPFAAQNRRIELLLRRSTS